MIKVLLFAACLAGGTILSADVITSVTCNVSGPLTATDPHSCSLQGPDQGPFGSPDFANATANASFSLVSDPNSFSSLSVNQYAEAAPGVNNAGTLFAVSSARSQVSVNETLFTTGSMRPGFVQISAAAGSAGNFRGDVGSLDISLESVAISCFPSGQTAVCILWPNGFHSVPGYQLPFDGRTPLTGYYPFTLGQAFNFSYSGSAAGFSDVLGVGAGYANIQLQFRFFEADGVTPAAVQAVPEPATFALFGVALGFMAAFRRKPSR